MTRRIVYSRRAREQMTDLYNWIADESGFPARAESYVTAVLDYCDDLTAFPFVGVARDDLRPGLCAIGFDRRVMIAFAVTDETVDVLGVYYGGRDFENLIASDPDEL